VKAHSQAGFPLIAHSAKILHTHAFGNALFRSNGYAGSGGPQISRYSRTYCTAVQSGSTHKSKGGEQHGLEYSLLWQQRFVAGVFYVVVARLAAQPAELSRSERFLVSESGKYLRGWLGATGLQISVALLQFLLQFLRCQRLHSRNRSGRQLDDFYHREQLLLSKYKVLFLL